MWRPGDQLLIGLRSHVMALAVLASAMIPIGASSATAQLAAATFDSRAANRAWGAAAFGGAQGAGLTSQYELRLAHGPLTLGYQVTSADNLAGTSRTERALLGGVRLPFGPASLMLTTGPGTVSECVSNGEQSGTCTRSSHNQTAFDLAVGLTFSRYVGGRVAYSGALTGGHGFKAVVVGIEIGKLR